MEGVDRTPQPADRGACQWFSLSDLPSGAVHGIEWRWPGYAVPGAVSVDRSGNRYLYEVRQRELVPLPVIPTAWRPVLSGWRWPRGAAPTPLQVSVAPRMAMIGGVAFDAAASSEELEAERVARRDNPDVEPESPGQWWRDVAAIAYEPKGSVTVRHGEARIMRALILERSIRLDLAPYRTNAAALAALKLTLADVLAEEPGADWVPPLIATPEDWRDFETVMGWLVDVMPSRRQMFVMRCRMKAPPATWVQIGDEIGRTEGRARQIYEATIQSLVEVANKPRGRARARLAALRDRNREARLG